METSDVGYGRCSGCQEIKYVRPDGTVADHNGYDVHGTSVAVVLCPGSNRAPVADEGKIARAS